MKADETALSVPRSHSLRSPTGNFPPLASGSRVSKLVQKLEAGHNNVKLSKTDWERIYTWIDLNCNYYATWEMSRPYSTGGRDAWAESKDNRRWKTAKWLGDVQAAMAAAGCGDCHGDGRTKRINISAPWINLTRPEHSRLLNAHLSKRAGGLELTQARNKKTPPVWPDTKHADYRAILEAIQAGKRALDAKPRMDMPERPRCRGAGLTPPAC